MDVSPAEKRDGKPEKDFPPHILISVSRERRRGGEKKGGGGGGGGARSE